MIPYEAKGANKQLGWTGIEKTARNSKKSRG